jgi:hypothetical protein
MGKRWGSYVKLNIYGTNKMAIVFVLEQDMKGHPDRMVPYIKQLLKEIDQYD